MSLNVCLICCYSFQEKRNRIISDEARDSFRKFCSELSIPLERCIEKETCGLDLPYGERITVCGDCLSLVVSYVQQRTIQIGKEDKLLELQKAVCTALNDLQNVLEEVQNQIDGLHSAVRTGDESNLDSFCRKTKTDKENNPRAFRAKILKLNTGLSKAKNLQKDGLQIPINIKLEPRENDGGTRINDNDEDDGHFDDSFCADPEDDQDKYFEDTDFPTPKITDTAGKGNKGEIRRNSRRSSAKLLKYDDGQDNSEGLMNDFSDFDDAVMTGLDENEDEQSYSVDTVGVKKTTKRGRPPKTKSFQSQKEAGNLEKPSKGKRKRNPKIKSDKMGKRIKADSASTSSNLEKLQEEISQWKDDLLGRIVMQMNTDIHEGGNDTTNSDSDSFQYIDGMLKFRGVPVAILEKQRSLQCRKCRKMFFQTRDADTNGEGVQLETLVRDHILTAHNPDAPPNLERAIDCVPYSTIIKKKESLRLACPQKYTYIINRTFKGVVYYVCDYRAPKCNAMIWHKNGLYFRSQKGWNPDGSHMVHAPDVERTNQRMEAAKAIAMYVADPSRSVDDVCSEMLKQSNGQLLNSLGKLKMRMLWAKHSTYDVPEEKNVKTYPCPHCDSVYKDKRSFLWHVKQHQDNSSEADQSHSQKTRKKKARGKKTTKAPQGTDTEALNPPPPQPGSSEAPSIVFKDPPAASNFVNKCISAIMKEVGFSVPSNDSTQIRPVSATSSVSSDNSRVESVSTSQQSQGQWQHPSSSHSGVHHTFPPNQNPSSSGSQQIPGWPWTAH